MKKDNKDLMLFLFCRKCGILLLKSFQKVNNYTQDAVNAMPMSSLHQIATGTVLTLALSSHTACRDSSKLLGDSNVYLDSEQSTDIVRDTAIESTETDEGTETDTDTDTTSTSIDEPLSVPTTFDSVQSQGNAPQPTSTLALAIKGSSLEISHTACAAPCTHDFQQSIVTASPTELLIDVNYAFDESDNTNSCYFDLVYSLQLQGMGLPAGEYTVQIHDSSATIDLTSLLLE